MNAIDFAKGAKPTIKSVMAVHYAGDYGDDAAAGAKYAAEKLGLTFTDTKTDPGQDKQAGAIGRSSPRKPDLVILTTAPAEAAVIVGGLGQQAATSGYAADSHRHQPDLEPGAERQPGRAGAGRALLPVGTMAAVGGGHARTQGDARGADPDAGPLSDGYTVRLGLVLPAQGRAGEGGREQDLTRAGLLAAAKSLTSVDYEGMLPTGSGNFKAGQPARSR